MCVCLCVCERERERESECRNLLSLQLVAKTCTASPLAALVRWQAESNGYMVSKQELEAVYLAYHRAGAADRAHAILGRLQKLKAKMSNHVYA